MKFKKWVVTLVCNCVIVATLVGCGGSSKQAEVTQVDGEPKKIENFNQENFPIVNDKIELNIATMQMSLQKDFSEMQMWKDYEEMTNVKINWTSVPYEFLAEKRNIMMASATDLPDAFFKMAFPATDIGNYAEQGLFIKLDDLIDQYGPNIKKALEEYPDVNSGIRMEDGNIYSLPYIVSAQSPGVGGKIFFDKTVLEATNQEVPTTIEEFYNVLKGMQGYDLNGNGVDDEIPFGAAKINDIIGALKGAWGLGTRGGSHANVDVDPKTGELRYIPISQEYKEVLMFTKKLYDEKLIDQEIFTMDTSKMMAKGESGRYLSHTYVNHTNVGQKYQDNQVPLTTALKGPYGDQLVPTSSNLGTIGAFVIPKTNKHPEVTMRWIDYFYSEEGMRMMFMGKEGVTYEVTADGKYEFLPEVMENPNGLSYEQALGQYVCYAGGANPSIAGEDYFRGPAMLPTAVEAAQNLIPFKADVIWPAFVYSKADNAEMQTLSGDITSYLKEMTAKFITGKVSFDEWDKYVAELNKMGLEKYMDIYKRTSEKYE